MKYLKTYKILNEDLSTLGEHNNIKLKIGDYVLCDEILPYTFNDIYNFTKNNIGKLIHITNYDDPFSEAPYIIKYDNIPKKLPNYYFVNEKGNDSFSIEEKICRRMKLSEIKYWSDNKEDLETILISNKYNL